MSLEKAQKIHLMVEEHLSRQKKPMPEEYRLAVQRSFDAHEKGEKAMNEAIKNIPLESSHPQRNLQWGLMPLAVLFLEEEFNRACNLYCGLIEDLSEKEISLNKIANFLIANVESVKSLTDKATQSSSGTNNTGPLMNILVPHRFMLSGRAYFHVDQALCEGLINTSFGLDTPANFLRSPLPYCYIEFGHKRNLDVYVHNEQSGLHQIEGVYISEQKAEDFYQNHLLDHLISKGIATKNSHGIRSVELDFTGSPLGKSNAVDDATFNISLLIDDDSDATVEQICEAHIEYYKTQSQQKRPYKAKDLDEEAAGFFVEGLELLVKCLIFINSDLSVKKQFLERPTLLESLKRTTKKDKTRKIIQKLNRAKDYILITSKEPLSFVKEYGSGEEKSKSAHWRRGHFRNQRYGQGNKEVKVKWIQPTLVGIGQATPKRYEIKP